MLGAPVARLPSDIAASLDAANEEWRSALGSRLDFPETQLQLAGMALASRSIPAAISAFREAVRLDPQRSEAWVMLIRIAAATEGVEAAREVAAEAFSAVPADPAVRQLRRELRGP